MKKKAKVIKTKGPKFWFKQFLLAYIIVSILPVIDLVIYLSYSKKENFEAKIDSLEPYVRSMGNCSSYLRPVVQSPTIIYGMKKVISLFPHKLQLKYYAWEDQCRLLNFSRVMKETPEEFCFVFEKGPFLFCTQKFFERTFNEAPFTLDGVEKSELVWLKILEDYYKKNTIYDEKVDAISKKLDQIEIELAIYSMIDKRMKPVHLIDEPIPNTLLVSKEEKKALNFKKSKVEQIQKLLEVSSRLMGDVRRSMASVGENPDFIEEENLINEARKEQMEKLSVRYEELLRQYEGLNP